MIPVFRAADVRAAVSPHEAYDAVREAFVAYARGRWSMQPKVYVTNYPAGDFRAMPSALEAGEITERLKAANPEISVLARAHSEAEVKHLLEHGADAAVLAERELAYSLADMVMATPPYRAPRPATGAGRRSAG